MCKKINEFSAEINQRIESIIKETDCLNPRYQELSTMQQSLASMKIYFNELQNSLIRKQEFFNKLKYHLVVLFLSGVGTFIGVSGTLYLWS